MKTNHLDALLEKLCGGDPRAVEEVFLAYEPYLRMVVRRLLPNRLRAKFDSCDVVQSVWVDVLQGFRGAGWHFQSAAHLRAFLIKATRNRFIDRFRQHRRAAAHEHSLDQALQRGQEPANAGPGEFAQANELWEELLALCPPSHRSILQLKREGCALQEIADQTGLHPSSIRRILYDLGRAWAAAQARRTSPKAGPLIPQAANEPLFR